MATLSQPQTPSPLDSPLREHRHRPVERLTDRLETPSLDDRSYRVIKLLNQLEVLLVHDADTDKASAAMDVNVGNFSDEEDLPGLAHAVEHMLFMGTKKVCVFTSRGWICFEGSFKAQNAVECMPQLSILQGI
jgi:insulysin